MFTVDFSYSITGACINRTKPQRQTWSYFSTMNFIKIQLQKMVLKLVALNIVHVTSSLPYCVVQSINFLCLHI